MLRPCAALLLVLAACADDIEPGDEQVSTTTAELSYTGHWAWGTPGNNGPLLDLGSSATQTCFLTGVTGSLKGADNYNDDTEAEADVFMQNGHWWIRTTSGYGSGVEAWAMCISATANRVVVGWNGDWKNPNFVPATPNRYCFLTEVRGKRGWTGTYNGGKTGAWLTNNGANWVISGHLEPLQDGTSGGGATATCVDIPHQWSGDGWSTAPNPGNQTWNAGYNSGGMGCFLTGLWGNYALSSPPYGWDDGVNITYNSSTHWFEMNTRSGKGGGVTCVQ